MRSLDTLPLLRPKAEAGRAPSGEDPRAGAAPDFEAMLGALESGTAPTGDAAVKPAEADADRPAPPADTAVVNSADTAGSALQALMALAGPGPATPAVTPGAEAGLDAMVQRAVARAGAGANPAPADPVVQISQVGLETHFAPVRPRGGPPPAMATTGPGADASAALPATADTAPAVASSHGGMALPSPPRMTAVPETTAPVQPRMGPSDEVLPPSADAAPLPSSPGEAPDPAVGSTPPIPRDALPTAAPILVSQRPEAETAPTLPDAAQPAVRTGPVKAAAATAPAPPTPPAPGADRPVVPVATEQPADVAAAQQAGVAEGLRSPARRGRTALHGDPAEPAGPIGAAAPPSGRTARADLATPPAAPGPVAAGQAPRDPMATQERAPGLARPEPVAVPRPRAEADGESGGATGSADAVTARAEAPRPDLPLAEPIPQAVGSTPAPVPASPLRQIVDAVAAQLPAPSAAQARPLPASAEAGPLKILTLQLHPADLGSVLVRMRLQDGRLEMSLRTSREETAERLRKEGDLLSGLLREAGYAPEAVTIQAGSAGTGESGARGQGFAAFAGQGGQHDRQPGAATPDHSGRRPSPRVDATAPSTEEPDHETETRGRDRDSLYL